MKRSTIGLLVLSFGLLTACGGGGGPEIKVDNVAKQLCQRTVSGAMEGRCREDSDSFKCENDFFCWRPDPASCQNDGDCPGDTNLCVGGTCQQACTADATCPTGTYCIDTGADDHCQTMGYCRKCRTDGNCDVGYRCDHGQCHKICTTDGDCPTSTFCTAGVCRLPHTSGTEVEFCNSGSSTLEVYLSQTKLLGLEDACAFKRIRWAKVGESALGDTARLEPGECSLIIQVSFTPPEVGDYYAVIEVPSNASNVAVVPLAFYGQAVEAACFSSLDGTCTPECNFTEDDPKLIDILQNRPTPTCD